MNKIIQYLYLHHYQRIGKIHMFLKRIGIPLCNGFDGWCFHIGKKRRQRTAYYDDELNWVFMCDECMKYNNEYWNDMWNEYYSQVI